MTTADAAQVLGPIDFVLIEMPAGATTDQTGLALGDLLDLPWRTG